ncbi:hypothetical protein [Anaerostipes sp.]|uniref:hypothetical protein n=1 Tax=Anaerostipes sp. TaxID=1872530 RepID=UPI003991E74E
MRKKSWCVVMLTVGMLFPTIVYGNDNCLTKDNIEISEVASVERIENDRLSSEVNSIQKVTSDKLKYLSQFADIQITEYEDNRVEYSFIPKRPEKIGTYNNGEQLGEYEMVKLTALPSNQNAEIDLNSAPKASYSFQEGDDVQETITKKHSDVRLRGTYNYTEGIAKEPGARVKVAKLNWVSGCVVKRTERFGKNLKLYADASGDRVNSKGKTIKPGKEKTSVKTIASPKIGKTYKLVTGFKYYYSLSTVGNIHGSVTYQLSHNGKTYYKVSNVFNKGNFRA